MRWELERREIRGRDGVMHPKSETRRRAKMRGHSAVIMEMTDEQTKSSAELKQDTVNGSGGKTVTPLAKQLGIRTT
jgi:hypothetical protein